MEGISHEACSLAGTLGLGKLIAFYDDNGISIDGHVEGWFTDDTPKRFEAYGWHVDPRCRRSRQRRHRSRDLRGQGGALQPSLICCKTLIGKGAPTKAGSHDSHGAPLGEKRLPPPARRWVGRMRHSRCRGRSTRRGMRGKQALLPKEPGGCGWVNMRKPIPLEARRVAASLAWRLASEDFAAGSPRCWRRVRDKAPIHRYPQGIPGHLGRTRARLPGAARRLGRPGRLEPDFVVGIARSDPRHAG